MAWEKPNEYSTDYGIIKPEDTQGDKKEYSMGIHWNDRIISEWAVNAPKEFVDNIIKPIVKPTNGSLMKDFTMIKNKETEEVERRLCTIKKIYHYPIVWEWKKIRGYWIILKPDELKENESKNFIISYVYDDKEHPKFRYWDKVLYVNNWKKTIITPRNKRKKKK